MKMIKLSNVILNLERISAVVTDPGLFDASGPMVPPGGSLVLFDGQPPLAIRAEDARILDAELSQLARTYAVC